MPPILLLHLSDLHFGPHGRFLGEDPDRLGKGFHRALAAAQRGLRLERKVDLVIVTGDVAEAGKPSELKQGRQFLSALGGELGLPPERFVFVPGNHDVNWASCKRVESELDEREELTPERLRSRLDEVKLDAYYDLLKRFYGVEDLAAVSEPLARGARLYRFSDLHLAVAALNSCEKESHRKEDHVGLVGREQAESVSAALRRADLATWLKVVAVHHNPDVTTANNLASMREDLLAKGALDADLLARFESDALGLEGRERLVAVAADAQVQLLLHGHHHARSERTWPWRVRGTTHLLSAGSLWLRPDKLLKDEPASARLILLDPEAREIRAESLVYLAWHRVEGSVEWGGFAPDPAGPYVQRLDLPEGFASPQEPAPPRAALDVDFMRAFRQRMSDLYSRWDVGSLGALRPGATRDDDAQLANMYVELRFGRDHSAAPGDEKCAPLRGEDLLGRDVPVLLRGRVGAGKTTWTRYTFGRLVRDERALPLMLVLRDVARRWRLPGCEGEERSIDAALDTWIGEKMGAGWKGRLRHLLKAFEGPRPILLVDGWDELGPLGSDLRGMLVGFLREHPRVLAVVTSRPYGQQPPSHSDGFEVLDLQPLDGAEVETLTRSFFQRFSGAGQDGAERDVGAFLSALERSPEARDLARTPLLLTMMLLVGHSQPLPEKRHLLYDKCIDALLHARPEQRAAEGALAGRHVWKPPGIEEGRRWVAALAHAVQTAGYKTAYKPARAPIVRSWEEMKSLLPEECPRDKRDGFLAWLIEDAGLLADRADGTLAFAHLSFQEYLTANHLETTAAGPEERLAAFADRLGDSEWWETLRLLAAQIDGRNPAFLASVLEGLIATAAEGGKALAFVGTVLADGVGSPTAFAEWTDRWVHSLQRRWSPLTDICAGAWRAARQGERKSTLAKALAGAADAQSWLGYIRFALFGEGWAPPPSRPSSPVSSALVGELAGEELSAAGVAAGRLLCGSFPLWPPQETGLCQLWPSGRRLQSLRLQGAVATGASRQELAVLARSAVTTVADALTVHDWARDWARDLANYWAHNVSSEWARYLGNYWPHNWPRPLALDLARDWARYVPRDWAHFLPRDWPRDEARGWARYLADNWARYLLLYLTRDSTREWPRYLPRDLTRDWPHDWAHYWARDLASYWAHDWTRYWARDWTHKFVAYSRLDRMPEWLEVFAVVELFSFGRVASRVSLSKSDLKPTDGVAGLLAHACRLSLRPEERADLVVPESGEPLDPLWPALARHLARRSTAADRKLLIDLAHHPEKREPPLRWGLQFIVRGDLMLDDGSFLTLDELAEEAGIEPLPYLDEMEPELEVDWDAEA